MINLKLKAEKIRKEYLSKCKQSSTLSDTNTKERPITPPVIAMVIVGRLYAFTATNEQSGKIATQEINAEDLSKVVAQCNVRESEEIFSVTKSATGPIYELNNSWILDSRATIHITNHISKFLEINSTSDVNEILWAGNTVILSPDQLILVNNRASPE